MKLLENIYTKNIKGSQVMASLNNNKKSFCSITLLLRAGVEFDRKYKSGIRHLFEHLSSCRSNKFKNQKQIDKYTQTNFIYPYAKTTNDYILYNYQFIKKSTKEAVNLLFDSITRKEISEKDLNTTKKIVLTENLYRSDFPTTDSIVRFTKNFWNKRLEENIFPIIGTKESISNIKASDISGLRSDILNTKRFIIALVGNLDLRVVEEILENRLERIGPKDYTEYNLLKLKNIKPEFSFDRKDSLSMNYLILSFPIKVDYKSSETIKIRLIARLIARDLKTRLGKKLASSYDNHTYVTYHQSHVWLKLIVPIVPRLIHKSLKEIFYSIRDVGKDVYELDRVKYRHKFDINAYDSKKIASFLASSRFYGEEKVLNSKYFSALENISQKDIVAYRQKKLNSKNCQMSIQGPDISDMKVFDKYLEEIKG